MTGRLILCCTAAALAQAPQNPSPMVEHTRSHLRLTKESPPGKRILLEPGTLFVPDRFDKRDPALLVFFHGGSWLPEVAAARRRMAAVTVQLGAGSGTYARAFSDPARFQVLIRAAEQSAGVRFRRVILGGWSAGCGAIRELLRWQPVRERVTGMVAIDGIHAGYRNGKPGPLESELETKDLEIWVAAVRDAAAGRIRLLITHSEIFPGTYASTTETADYLLKEAGVPRRPMLRWGPMGTQQLSEARAGHFLLKGYAGNSAPDHVDQLHSLPEYLEWMR